LKLWFQNFQIQNFIVPKRKFQGQSFLVKTLKLDFWTLTLTLKLWLRNTLKFCVWNCETLFRVKVSNFQSFKLCNPSMRSIIWDLKSDSKHWDLRCESWVSDLRYEMRLWDLKFKIWDLISEIKLWSDSVIGDQRFDSVVHLSYRWTLHSVSAMAVWLNVFFW